MITVVGLGEVGLATFKEICKKEKALGVDINEELIKALKSQGFKVSTKLPETSNIYVICVYTTEQVLKVIEQINYKNKPLVVIESTLRPGTINQIKDKNIDIVLFPHRYNKNDPQHAIFNLDRIIGGNTKEATERALKFYSKFMDKNLIHIFPIEIVELSKPLENAYRFIEITIAEELKRLCDEKGIDFDKLRQAANTKWNIDIKEARNGIDGKCLPKDMKIVNDFFKENKIFSNVIEVDKEYKEKLKKK